MADQELVEIETPAEKPAAEAKPTRADVKALGWSSEEMDAAEQERMLREWGL